MVRKWLLSALLGAMVMMCSAQVADLSPSTLPIPGSAATRVPTGSPGAGGAPLSDPAQTGAVLPAAPAAPGLPAVAGVPAPGAGAGATDGVASPAGARGGAGATAGGGTASGSGGTSGSGAAADRDTGSSNDAGSSSGSTGSGSSSGSGSSPAPAATQSGGVRAGVCLEWLLGTCVRVSLG